MRINSVWGTTLDFNNPIHFFELLSFPMSWSNCFSSKAIMVNCK